MKNKVILGVVVTLMIIGGGLIMMNKEQSSKVKADSSVHEVSKRPSTVVGKLDIVTLYMNDKYSGTTNSFVEGKEARTIRIWVPESYNPEDTTKRYPVLYMHDGQNVFDDATSFCGEWGVDETITDLMNNKEYEGSIVVGIDNSDYREPEMKPTWDTEDSLADRYSDFIVNTVKPYVDANYNTLTDAAHTGIGGSSMGGLISFYMGMKHPEIFGYEVCFAPAFLFVTEEQITSFMERHDIKNKTNPKIYMFCGGQDLDAQLYPYVEPVKNCIINNGYDSNLVTSYIDMSKGHNESAWREYFPQAYNWLLDIK